MIFLWIAAALAALAGAAGFLLAWFSTSIRRQTLDQARAWQSARYDISWYDRMNKTDYTVRCRDGYIVHAQLLPCPEPSRRYVILSHGYTDNRIGSLKYAKMYLDMGFQVIVYDLRGHGENEKTYCTYSVRESRDLNDLIQDTLARFPDAESLGLHGESLGSAASIAALRAKPPVDFVVADCGFSEIESIMRSGLSRMHLPGGLVHLVSLCVKLRTGWSYRDMRPIDSLRHNIIPILFIHGAEDDFIPPAHSQAMADATKGWSAVHLIKGAGHAQSVLTAPEEYRKILKLFCQPPSPREPDGPGTGRPEDK